MKALSPLGTASTPREGVAAARDDAFEPRYLGWELARCAKDLTGDEANALAAIAGACVLAMLEGSTRVRLSRTELPLVPTAIPNEGCLRDVLERMRTLPSGDSLRAVVGRAGERKPLIVEDGWLYLERMHRLETSFCRRVLERRRPATGIETDDHAIRRAVAAVAARPPPLTVDQKRALGEALRAPLTLITGGPGTGKTTTVAALVRAAAWMGIPMDAIAIAAPTGKAAQRLAGAIADDVLSRQGDIADEALRRSQPSPLTLHRLLGWSPSTGRFARYEADPLSYRLVVVDEASMIDLSMMDRLMRALGNKGRSPARLVLLGDADQLPSIEAGTAFRDLCAGLGAVRLKGSLRVAPDVRAMSIATTATEVNQGSFPTSLSTRRTLREVTFEGAEHLEARWSDVAEPFLDDWWRRHLAGCEGFTRDAGRVYRWRGGTLDGEATQVLAKLLAGYARSRILCATRAIGIPACADAINRMLLGRLRRALGSTESQRGLGARTWREAVWLSPGAPVLVQRNDYARGLFNGDQGLVARVDFDDGNGSRLAAVFSRSGRLEAFPLDALADVAPAFAMTVHKAQGSEADEICLVLPELDLPILSRALIYTALTRARRSALVVGDKGILGSAIARATVRSSGVAERLRSAGLQV